MNKPEKITVEQTILEAFAEHRDVLVSYLAQKLLKPDDIDDLLQETFLQAFRAEKKNIIHSPKSYLFIIARNLLSKKFAKQAKEMTQEINDADFASLESFETTMDLQLHYQMKMNVFEKAVKSLPTQCRRVFILRKIYGLSQKKIAANLDISTSTVERHITIALTKLSVIMTDKGYNLSSNNVDRLNMDKKRKLKCQNSQN